MLNEKPKVKHPYISTESNQQVFVRPSSELNDAWNGSIWQNTEAIYLRADTEAEIS